MIFSTPDPAADPYFAAALLELQRTAFAIEARLIGTREIPPLQQDRDALTAFRGSWITVWDGVALVGAAAWRSTQEALEIDRVMVHPEAHRRGIGSALMDRIVVAASGRDIRVSTGRDNPPGIALYAKYGFVAESEQEVPPGVWITCLRRPGSG